MSNVITLNDHRLSRAGMSRPAGHAALFADHRRDVADVFWLKENAEFLNILVATGADADDVLPVYASVYDQMAERIAQYPQYYRFLLSICLDLEELGMAGDKGAAICEWAAREGLAEAELSDLQRAEAHRLLARRGCSAPDADLTGRLHRFIDRTATFAVPNKKAAYELTHIVFYLSDYGRCDPQISESAVQSLTFAGLLAFLDQDYDLLAEICVSLRYAGERPSTTWEAAVLSAHGAAQAIAVDGPAPFDDYHSYLVCGWLAGIAGRDPFRLDMPEGRAQICMSRPSARPLRDLSGALPELASGDWQRVRGRMLPRLGMQSLEILSAAEDSTDHFDAFYRQFARTSAPAL
ncbi:hypothetical protein E4Z66_04295 [Aliishimia ponticola]|uniref:Uncharacterized protein n=1 Tax=Aliishimia ponticola TaxID=2499833 RepID=A0A4S4NJ63_9RHOB|nr:hypothetical protein [Aliishimia ponticola]THH38787.1 hypothetical protein E4Z66_04295 [Aliishimia ponticola]